MEEQTIAERAAHFEGIAPCLKVHDIHKTVRWYEHHLGFQALRETKNFAHMQRDNVHIEFRRTDHHSQESHIEYNERRNLEILVADAGQIFNELSLRGANILWGPTYSPDRKVKFEVEDCNGYVILFTGRYN